MAMENEALVFDSVTKWYRFGRLLLNRCSLILGGHEKVLVCARNDKALTELFKLSAGTIVPDEGDIKRNGRMAFVPAYFPDIENMYVTDFLMLPLLVSGKTKREALYEAKALLRESGMYEKQAMRTQFLSEYDKCLLMLLMALITKPEVLFIDHCFGYLTLEEEKKFWQAAGVYINKTACAVLAFADHHDVPFEFDAVYMLGDGSLHRRNAG